MFGKLTPEEIMELREEQKRRDELAKKKRIPQPQPQRVPQPRKQKVTYSPKGMMSEFLHQMKPVTHKK
jgi:hypothetical protein